MIHKSKYFLGKGLSYFSIERKQEHKILNAGMNLTRSKSRPNLTQSQFGQSYTLMYISTVRFNTNISVCVENCRYFGYCLRVK